MDKSVSQSFHSRQQAHFTDFFLRSLLWNHSISKPFQYIALIVSHIQCTAILIYILLNRITAQPQDNLSDAIHTISGLISVRTLFGITIQYPIGNLIVMSVAFFAYFLVIIVTCVLVALQFRDKKGVGGKRNIILTYLCQFHIYIGFWVINVIVFSYLGVSMFTSHVTGLKSYQLVVCILFILFMVINYLFAALFVVYSYDPFMSSNPLSCHSPLFQITIFTFKALLAPTLVIIRDPLVQTWVMVVLSMLTLGFAHLHLISAFPYYQYRTMKVSLMFNAMNLLISFTSFICIILKTSDTNPSSSVIVYCLAVMIPLVLKLVSKRFECIVLRYLAIENKDLKSINDVMKKLFSLSYITSKSVFTFNNHHDKTQHELRFWGLLSNMDSENIIFSQESHARFTLTEMCSHYTNIGRNMIKHLLQDAILRFKHNSHFKVLFAKFTLENNCPFLATSVCIADAMKFSGHAKLAAQNLAQCLQGNIDEYFHENTGKVLHLQNFMELETMSDTLRKAILSISGKYNRFWMKYLHPTIKMKEVLQRSKEIEIEAEQITQIWESRASKNKIFAHQFSNIYSAYLSLVRGSPYEGQHVVERYYIRHLNGLYDLENMAPLSDHNIISPYVIAFHASMTPENPGQVLSSSSNLTKLLGWTHYDIIGHNVERIMPFFLQEAHQKMLSKHIEKSFERELGSRMYKTIDAFVLHKLGHIIPCEVYLSIHPFVQERPRYMVLTRIKKGKRDHLLVNRKGVIEGYTDRIGEVLGLSLDRRILLSSLCQHSAELEEMFSNLVVPEKGDYETLCSMKKIFSLDLQVSNKKKQEVQSYMVELTPRFFGDLFYFVLDLDEKGREPNTSKNKTQTENHAKNMNNSCDSLYNEIRSEENDVDMVPTFNASFFNIKMTLQSERFFTSSLPQETDIGLLSSPKMTRIRLGDSASKTIDKGSLTKPFTTETLNTQGPDRLISEPAEQVNLLFVDPACSLLSVDKFPLSPVGSAKALVDKIETKEDLRASTKDENTTNAMLRIMAASTIGLSKSSTSRIEKAVKHVPKSKKVRKLYALMVLFIIILSTPLIVFHFYNQNTLVLVQSTINTISKSIFRLVAIADLGEYVRILWDFEIGLFDSERYHDLGWTDNSTEYIRYLVSTYTTDLLTKNNELRSFVYELDTSLQKELYSESLPIYEMDEYGVIKAERKGNSFDIITELVSEATLFLTSDLPLDKNNPHMMFVLNNTFNDLLTSSEQAVYVLNQDIEVKFAHQSEYLYWFMSILGVVGILLLIFFYQVEKSFIRDRRHFISVFSLLKESAIDKHLQEVQDFLNLLDAPIYETKKINIKPGSSSGTFYGYSAARSRNTRHSKKVADTKGINNILILLYCGTIVFVLVLFSVYPVLILDVRSCSNSVLTKTNLMIKSNLNFFYVNFLFKVLYEYVQENRSTNIMNKPIKQEWEQIYNDMAETQTFFLMDLLQPGNDVSDNSELRQMVNGNMCAILDFPPPYEYAEVICNRIGGGDGRRGLVGLVGYVLSSVKLVKDYFDNSAKTWEDMQYALAIRGLVDVEDFYYDNLRAIIWVDELIRTQITNDFSQYEDSLIEIIIPYLIAYIIFGGMLSKKITRVLQREISDWRKVIRQIPHPIMSEDKQMKAYLAKISEGMLEVYD